MESIIDQIAQNHNTTPEEVRTEMEKAIHAAYLNRTPAFLTLFGDREPSIKEIVLATALMVQDNLPRA